jgi:hypothetical protein
LRAFIHNNPDFRSSRFQGVNLQSPLVLITAETDRHTIHSTLLPIANSITEGSVWDLASPSMRTWTTQRNRTPYSQIHNWLTLNTNTPWAGIQATAQQPFQPNPYHDAYLPVSVGQRVTILAPPFWIWRDWDLLAGTYMVPVTTFHTTAHLPTPTATSSTSTPDSPTGTRTTDEQEPMALLGLVPLASFLYSTD